VFRGHDDTCANRFLANVQRQKLYANIVLDYLKLDYGKLQGTLGGFESTSQTV
jgi:hypothetical protein